VRQSLDDDGYAAVGMVGVGAAGLVGWLLRPSLLQEKGGEGGGASWSRPPSNF